MTFFERYKLAWNRRLPFFRILGPALLLFSLYRIYPMVGFWMNSQDAVGTVVDISSTNGTCKSNKKCAAWGNHECTKFNAMIEFSSDSNLKHKIVMDAGHADGFNRSMDAADFNKGSTVEMKYNPKIRKVYSTKQIYDFITLYSINIFFGIFFSIAGYWKYLRRTPPVNLNSGMKF
jgi:hypothetical protein